eukprot:NODE_209_length_1805_cov_170.642286.p1 GENE.NODE_209_length_1805_cov_170.642286~~NODE_209_length_1805_cov_170.642286.p1  ORF type:complete len:477 (+),score=163.26 NODE_209_length_1805_cov_170.642286:3-1433(+)
MGADEAVWARYEKLSQLGAGHFGTVFCARERCTGKTMAIKVLDRIVHERHVDFGDGVNEVSVLKALAHPNLLRIFEVVSTPDEVYVVTERAEGGSLAGYSSSMPVDMWVRGAMLQIVGVAAYCHKRHVLHGDLKPENVLVGGTRPDGTPFCIVCDFGHTTICMGAQTQVAAPGDPRYIAPEVMSERFLSPKSDVYMLGVTAFELLTGGWLPFFGQKAVSVHMSYYQLKVGGVRERMLSAHGVPARDLRRLATASPAAQKLVKSMLAHEESCRPSAIEAYHSDWFAQAHAVCAAAYDAQSANVGWGLWCPQHEHFAERLLRRARRPWSFKLLVAIVAKSTTSQTVYGMRLLFRRMEATGHGVVQRSEFHEIGKAAGLEADLMDTLFDGADLHEQGFLDYKNLHMLFFNLDAFTDDELLVDLASAANRMQGPLKVLEDFVFNADQQLKTFVEYMRSNLPEGQPITPASLLELLRRDNL